ncbi:MAG: Bax inhibitor-1 family protein [Roseibacillus sp.]
MFDSYQNPYVVAEAPADVRVTFIRKTYAHLAGAIAAFVALEFLLFQIPGIEKMVMTMMGGRFSWLFVLGGFMVVSWLANKWAMSSTSMGMQYAGLGIYVVAEAIIFLPLLLIAAHPQFLNQPQIIGQAAIITGALFGGLTLIAFTTKKDFSFLGGILKMGFFVAMGLIVASIFMGFNLGLLFSGAMILLASISILYSTSNIIHHYGTTQYVAAALGLFASVALLFWYVLRILMAFSGRD